MVFGLIYPGGFSSDPLEDMENKEINETRIFHLRHPNRDSFCSVETSLKGQQGRLDGLHLVEG